MVYADHIKDTHEVTLLNKLVIGLGFQTEMASKVVNTSLKLASNKVDFETFQKEMNLLF